MFRFDDEERLAEQGRTARNILTSLQGATEKTLAAIESLMPHPRE
jgi:hypothetical protein